MSTLETLIAAQRAAHAAWTACPDKRRADKARLAAELDAATKAVAAAKRAAAPAPTATAGNAALVRECIDGCLSKQAAEGDAIDRALARQARTRAEMDLRTRVQRALYLRSMANEWPRCGEAWGGYPGEQAAADLLDRLAIENPALLREMGA